MTKRILLIFLFVAIVGGSLLGYKVFRTQELLLGPDAPKAQNISNFIPSIATIPSIAIIPPAVLNIDLPFYTQAPFSNWDYPWQEACEEASSALVANLYLEKNWTREEFNDELIRLVDWEMKNFGAYEHTTIEQTAQMIRENYNLKTIIHDNPSYEDLQKTLAEGHLIVAPFAGKLLGNPNFKNGGPPYHMLVIKGYDSIQNQVVTHDVGTRNGADYVYSWAVIANALHDWNGENIELGTPRWIEIYFE